MQLFLFFASILGIFSGKSPVTWTYTAEKINDKEYNLIFTATIEDGWNIYSQYMKGDDGPVKTSFTYDESKSFVLVGKNEESGDIKKGMDDMFGMEVIKIKKKGVFTQRIKVSDISKPINVTVEYMCCNEMQCLPPKQVPFNIQLNSIQ